MARKFVFDTVVDRQSWPIFFTPGDLARGMRQVVDRVMQQFRSAIRSMTRNGIARPFIILENALRLG
jgi:hypothetical protein